MISRIELVLTRITRLYTRPLGMRLIGRQTSPTFIGNAVKMTRNGRPSVYDSKRRHVVGILDAAE